MSRSAIIVGRVGAVPRTAGRGASASAAQPPAVYSAPAGEGFIEKAKQYVDPGETSSAPTFGGAALGALLAPKIKKTNPYVGALAGAAIGNLAGTLISRAQGGLDGSEIGKLALTTAAYAGTGAAVAHFSKKTSVTNGALIGMGLPVLAFAAYRAFMPQS